MTQAPETHKLPDQDFPAASGDIFGGTTTESIKGNLGTVFSPTTNPNYEGNDGNLHNPAGEILERGPDGQVHPTVHEAVTVEAGLDPAGKGRVHVRVAGTPPRAEPLAHSNDNPANPYPETPPHTDKKVRTGHAPMPSEAVLDARRDEERKAKSRLRRTGKFIGRAAQRFWTVGEETDKARWAAEDRARQAKADGVPESFSGSLDAEAAAEATAADPEDVIDNTTQQHVNQTRTDAESEPEIIEEDNGTAIPRTPAWRPRRGQPGRDGKTREQKRADKQARREEAQAERDRKAAERLRRLGEADYKGEKRGLFARFAGETQEEPTVEVNREEPAAATGRESRADARHRKKTEKIVAEGPHLPIDLKTRGWMLAAKIANSIGDKMPKGKKLEELSPMQRKALNAATIGVGVLGLAVAYGLGHSPSGAGNAGEHVNTLTGGTGGGYNHHDVLMSNGHVGGANLTGDELPPYGTGHGLGDRGEHINWPTHEGATYHHPDVLQSNGKVSPEATLPGSVDPGTGHGLGDRAPIPAPHEAATNGTVGEVAVDHKGQTVWGTEQDYLQAHGHQGTDAETDALTDWAQKKAGRSAADATRLHVGSDTIPVPESTKQLEDILAGRV